MRDDMRSQRAAASGVTEQCPPPSPLLFIRTHSHAARYSECKAGAGGFPGAAMLARSCSLLQVQPALPAPQALRVDERSAVALQAAAAADALFTPVTGVQAFMQGAHSHAAYTRNTVHTDMLPWLRTGEAPSNSFSISAATCLGTCELSGQASSDCRSVHEASGEARLALSAGELTASCASCLPGESCCDLCFAPATEPRQRWRLGLAPGCSFVELEEAATRVRFDTAGDVHVAHMLLHRSAGSRKPEALLRLKTTLARSAQLEGDVTLGVAPLTSLRFRAEAALGGHTESSLTVRVRAPAILVLALTLRTYAPQLSRCEEGLRLTVKRQANGLPKLHLHHHARGDLSRCTHELCWEACDGLSLESDLRFPAWRLGLSASSSHLCLALSSGWETEQTEHTRLHRTYET